jgi:hypothetical protein
VTVSPANVIKFPQSLDAQIRVLDRAFTQRRRELHEFTLATALDAYWAKQPPLISQ